MATIIKYFVQIYRQIIDVRDPRTADWFLAKTPFPLIGILTAYWFFVYKWGPALMKNRKPLNIDRIIQVYNVLQVVLCLYLVKEGLVKSYGPTGTYNWFCEPVDFSDAPDAVSIAFSVYIYFLIKVLDLFDTVFFILRKKQSQVTFLHVYHHMGMTIVGFLGAVFLPGGQGVFLGLVNCFVHAIMYSYYFLTIWNPEYKTKIWWKKYITQLQLIQFFTLMVQNIILAFHPDCGYPWWSALFFVPQNFFFCILFSDFYKRNYCDKRK